MKKVFGRPSSLKNVPFRYCPGCGHSLIHRLIAESVDTLGLRDRAIGIAPVGCAVFAYDYFDFDMIECAHGRPPSVATAIKRVRNDNIVFSYQGDGDLAAIGIGEIIHTAARGENISVFFVNNTTYGMTGGQMAPTTLIDQKTTTTSHGRTITNEGYPLKVTELIAGIDGTAFAARASLDNIKNVLETKRLIRKVFDYQIQQRGFAFLEILSPCPAFWGVSPEESLKKISLEMSQVFKNGILKEATGV